MEHKVVTLQGKPLPLPELTLEHHAREALAHLEAMRSMATFNSLQHLRVETGSGFNHWLRRAARSLDWLEAVSRG